MPANATARAGERGARAHVRAVPEREVLLRVRAVDAERRRGRRTRARRGSPTRSRRSRACPRAPGSRRSRRPCTQPRAMNRIGGARRRLSSIARPSAASSVADRALDVGVREDLVQQVAEQLARRGEAAGDEVAHERADLAAGELLAVVGELQQPGEHVVGRGARSASCAARSSMRASMYAANSGKAPRSPRRARCGSSRGRCSPSGPSPRSRAGRRRPGSRPSMRTVTRFGSGTVNAGHEIGGRSGQVASRSARRRLAHERLGRVHELGRRAR